MHQQLAASTRQSHAMCHFLQHSLVNYNAASEKLDVQCGFLRERLTSKSVSNLLISLNFSLYSLSIVQISGFLFQTAS